MIKTTATAINVVFPIASSPEIYLVEDGGTIMRLFPQAFRERYIYPNHPGNVDKMYFLALKNWNAAGNIFTRLHRHLVYNQGASHSVEDFGDFKALERWLIKSMTCPIERIDVQVGGEVNHIFRMNSHILRVPANDPKVDRYLAGNTPTHYHYFPDYTVVPIAIKNLLSINPWENNDLMNAFRDFFMVWDNVAQSEKEDEVRDTSKQTPYKALMLFDDIGHANTYDGPVYLYSSAGIKLMTFTEYLHRVEETHGAPYQLVKVWRSGLSAIDQAHYDAMRKSTYPEKNGNKLGTIYMCFRALWYAATQELMSTTAWEDN